MLFDNSDASPDVLSQELRLNTALESVRDVTVPERVEIGGGIKSGAVYGLGGILADIALGTRVRLTPSLGAGAYHNGDGKDLGHAVQFRSQIELAYRFEDGQRLALAFSHISNASLSNQNPGTEILTLYYMVPLDLLF